MINTLKHAKPKRDKNGRWLAGSSPNPKGRPSRVSEICKLLESSKEDLIAKAINLALEGDVTALKLCLDRLAPPPKSSYPNVVVEGFSEANSVTEQCSLLLQAVGNGEISADVGLSILNMLNTLTKLKESEEIEQRLIAIESELKKRGAR